MADSCALFVYGSLLRGFPHHRELDGARFVAKVRTAPGYRLVRCGEYPALIAATTGVVHGELYELSAAHLRRLDRFEDCPRLYQRIEIKLDGDRIVYSYRGPRAACQAEVIAGGRWRAPETSLRPGKPGCGLV